MRSLRRFSGYISRQRWRLVAGSGAVLANCGTDLLKPWPLKLVVDNVIQHRPFKGGGIASRIVGLTHSRIGLLNLAVGLAVAAVILGAVFEYLGSRTLGALGQRMMVALRRDVFSLLQRRSLAFHDRQQVGDLVNRVTGDSDRVQDALVSSLGTLLPAVATMTAMVTIMVILDWQFALLALAVTPVLFLITFRYSRSIRAATRVARKHDGDVASMATETLSSIRVVQAFTREDDEDRRFGAYAAASSLASTRAIEVEARYGPLVDITNVVGASVVLWFGAHRVISGRMSVGVLLVFVAYLNNFYKPMKQLSKLTYQLAKGAASADRISEILEQDLEVRDVPGAVEAGNLTGWVRFDKVTFGYEPNRPVLHDVSFTVDPGEVVALVGPTGAGKSTLVSLIARFVDSGKGRVVIDGKDSRSYTLRSLRDNISMVLQEPILFRGSIYDNIAYGSPDATREQVEAAARAANVAEFVDALPNGYDTEIGERGVTLSGGQRQRISIARALIRNAPINILDEPTSGLDSASEVLVMDALEELVRGRTTFIIAHRLSTARRAGRIMVLDHGRIVEQGSHEELLAAGGLYRRLHDIQFESPAGIGSRPAPARSSSFNGRRHSPDGELPLDPEVPALAAIRDHGLPDILAAAGVPGGVEGVRVLKHHPGSRCTFAATVSGTPLVVKVSRRPRSAHVDLLRRLEREGLASGRAPTVAPLIGSIDELNLIVMGWLQGPRSGELLASGHGHTAGKRAAEWLHTIAMTDIDIGPRYDPEDAVVEAARSAAAIATADPDLGARADAIVQSLAFRIPTPSRTVLVHGSFSVSHVIDLGDGPGVIDWDGFGRGPIELDAGRYLARLLRYNGRAYDGAATAAAGTFMREGGGLFSEDTLAWYTSLALLKLARFTAHKQSDRWHERAAVLVGEAGRTAAAAS